MYLSLNNCNQNKRSCLNYFIFYYNLYVSDFKLFAFRGGLDKPKITYDDKMMRNSVIYINIPSYSFRLVLLVPNNNFKASNIKFYMEILFFTLYGMMYYMKFGYSCNQKLH